MFVEALDTLLGVVHKYMLSPGQIENIVILNDTRGESLITYPTHVLIIIISDLLVVFEGNVRSHWT